MFRRLFRATFELFMGIDRESGEALARRAGSYQAVYKFLEDHLDVGCPWCGADDPLNPYHASDCELVRKAH